MSIENLPEWVPFALRRPVPGYSTTGAYTDSINTKVVWHSTQGSGDPFDWYAISGGIPHLTIQTNGVMDQHYSLHRWSRALKNLFGGVNTNTDGAIQIEIVGFAGKGFTAAQHDTMRRLAAWFTQHGVPNRWMTGANPSADAYIARRGDGYRKLTHSQWDWGSGHCGHINVPENNHVDPQFLFRDAQAIERGFVDGANWRKRRRITLRINTMRARLRRLRLRRAALRAS